MKFNPDKGARFNTYAYTSILNEVRPTATNLKLPLVLPEHMMPIFHTIQCYCARHQIETGTEPSLEDIIRLLERDPSKESDVILVKKYLAEFSPLSPVISFTQRAHSHRAYNFELADNDDTPYDERIYLEELRQWIDTLPGDIYQLSQQELGVLYLRFQGMNFTQIGDHFGIARQHAHRSYKRALAKLEDSLKM
jgi:RNA polymerase sigma factor (sigma-70 family)